MLIRHSGADESKGVASDILVRQCLLNLRHVTLYALPTWAAGLVVRVLFDRARVRSVRRAWAMAFEAHYVCRFNQQSLVLSPMDVAAAGALHAPRIHDTLDEIIALHPVLVRGAVRKMCERHFTKFVLFKLPEVLQLSAHLESHRPVVILTADWVLQWLPLRMALDAGVVGLNKIKAGRIHDVGTRGVRNMVPSWPVTSFTAHIPFGNRFCFDGIVHRMAAVAKWACRALKIVRRV